MKVEWLDKELLFPRAGDTGLSLSLQLSAALTRLTPETAG